MFAPIWPSWTWHPIDPNAPDSRFGPQSAVARLHHTPSFGFCTDPSPEHARLSRCEAIRMRKLRSPRAALQYTKQLVSDNGEAGLSVKSALWRVSTNLHFTGRRRPARLYISEEYQ